MTSIQSINTETAQNTSSASSNASSASTVAAENVMAEDTSTTATEQVAPNSSDVKLSTRAQKIQKLNEEFFAGGVKSFKVTTEFIQRLEEYGLLTADQAKELGASVPSSGESASTVGELTDFIDKFKASLEEREGSGSLVEYLNQAKVVLENLDQVGADNSDISIQNITAALSDYMNSSDGQKLGTSDRQSLEQLQLALSIAGKLTPGSNSISEVNKYLEVYGHQ